MNPQTIKIQKYLADLGLGSRRRMERLVQQGCVKINHQPAKIGDRVSDKDRIHVHGKLVSRHSKKYKAEWLAYYKPEGQITTRRDPQERETVFSSLPRPRHGRWISVGRLDINTSGLLLFTNNGVQANYLMHPSNQINRVYMARVRGKLPQSQLKQLVEGIQLEDCMANFSAIEFGGGEKNNFWYRVTLAQGQYREVRRLFAALDHEVGRLIRIKYGEIELSSSLKRGQWRYLSAKEEALIQQLIDRTD